MTLVGYVNGLIRKKPLLLYIPCWHVSYEDYIESKIPESLARLKTGDIVFVEELYDDDAKRAIALDIFDSISRGTYNESERKANGSNGLQFTYEFEKHLNNALRGRNFIILVEPASKEAHMQMCEYEGHMSWAERWYLRGKVESCFGEIRSAIHNLAEHIKIRDSLSENFIIELSERYPKKNILIIRGKAHILYTRLHNSLHTKYTFEKINLRESSAYQMIELAVREAKGESISDEELKLCGLRSMITSSLTLHFSGSTNERVKNAREMTDKLGLTALYALSQYLSKSDAVRLHGVVISQLIFDWIVEYEKTAELNKSTSRDESKDDTDTIPITLECQETASEIIVSQEFDEKMKRINNLKDINELIITLPVHQRAKYLERIKPIMDELSRGR